MVATGFHMAHPSFHRVFLILACLQTLLFLLLPTWEVAAMPHAVPELTPPSLDCRWTFPAHSYALMLLCDMCLLPLKYLSQFLVMHWVYMISVYFPHWTVSPIYARTTSILAHHYIPTDYHKFSINFCWMRFLICLVDSLTWWTKFPQEFFIF